MTEPLTTCWLDPCRDVAHVVLYASAYRLAGRETRPRQPVAFCLKHGGEIYDVMRAWRSRQSGGLSQNMLVTYNYDDGRKSAYCPSWLVADLRNDRLPRTSPDRNGWPPVSPMATTRHQPGRR